MKRLGGFGISAKLLLLMLAFGAIPLGLSIAVGYTVSRAIIIDQSQGTLRELTAGQAAHLATELTRQRLLLRTITGQLPSRVDIEGGPGGELSALFEQSLPEDGVFDGLRIATSDGRVLASVALGEGAPHWPEQAPATDWTRRTLLVHREGELLVAYLMAVRVGGGSEPVWLEGHVRSEDFARLFAFPEHLADAIELAIFEGSGDPILIGHDDAEEGLTGVFASIRSDSLRVAQTDVAGQPVLTATSPIEGTDWYFVAALPLEIALAPLARLRDSAIISTVILILLIVLIGGLASRSVTTPLRELAGVARQFGKSGAYRRFEPRSADEIGLLVGSFNRMAEDLERSREEIERLHERDLERAQQLATVGELASGVAHEIRNPVTGVRGALELVLRDMPLDNNARLLLEEAERQLKRIEATTTQLLRYARPPELREVVVDANHLVDQAAHLVEAQAKAASVEMDLDGSARPVPIRVDSELMVQVLVNLMLNGIESMRSGGRLSAQVSTDRGRISISIRDTGTGIPAKARSEVFRPFYTTKHHGTGLGLSISQQIVARHGGSIRIEDTPGGGATFVIGLPLGVQETRSE